MWRAALPCRRTGTALLGLSLAAILAVAPAPAGSSADEGVPPEQVWALALPNSVKTVEGKQLKWLAARGVTTIIAFKRSQGSLQRLAASAKRSRMIVIAPRQSAPKKACRSAPGRTLSTCAAIVATPLAAVRLARRGLVDYVVIRVRTPQQLRMLRGTKAKRTHIVAILPLERRAAGRAAWRAGVAYASTDPALDLGLTSTPGARAQLGTYLSQIPPSRSAVGNEIQAPSSLLVTGRSTSTVTLRWTASTSAVSGYGVYADNEFVLEVSALSITLTGLQCGRTYAFGVDAYGAGGRSGQIQASAATNTCPAGGTGGGGGGTGSSAETSPPTAPIGLATTSSTQTSITVSWAPSTDNVGVAGYSLYRNGSAVGSSLVPSFSFSGLSCGTTYTLSVDSHDAAGNRSSPAAISAATSVCASGGDSSAPTTPGALAKTGSTLTSITVSWGASSDNVGVAGYGLYRNGSSTGSTPSTSASFTGLACGTSYTLGVDAYDAAGNRSTRRNLTTATSACPPSTDTQPPSVPQSMAFGTVTETTVQVVWTSSTDNVGVVGYRVLRDGLAVATVSTPGYTHTGLTCGTSYSFSLEAYDAAGNVSNAAEATGSTSTSACTTPPPPPPPPPPVGSGVAHVWVDVNGGSCVRQASAGSYSDAQACASFQAAYNAAASGDTVGVASGTHSGQTLAAGTKAVTFQGAASRPSVGHFVSAASNVTVRGLLIEDRSDRSGTCSTASWGVLVPCGSNQTFDDVIVDGLNTGDKHGVESPGAGFALKNSEIRNIRNMKGFEGGASDMLIENNYWHHITVTDSSVHNECMYVNNGNRSVYRGNLFIGCPTMALFFTNWNGGPAYRDVLVENNVFGHTLDAGGGWHGSCAFKVGWGYNNQNTVHGWVVRYNTFETGPCIDGTPAGGDNGAGQWYGNLGGIGCAAEWVYRYNVGQTCGGTGELSVANAVNSRTSPNAAPFYVNAPAGDFHLKTGTAPINRGDTNAYPSTDKDKKTRPIGPAPDAGAYEHGS